MPGLDTAILVVFYLSPHKHTLSYRTQPFISIQECKAATTKLHKQVRVGRVWTYCVPSNTLVVSPQTK